MWYFVESLQAIRDFIELGGQVLILISGITWLMWLLILERIWFLFITYPSDIRKSIQIWESRTDHHSWYAQKIRQKLISELSAKAEFSLGFIRTLVSLCPLLGLLGTVTGMIEVFDAMSSFGTGNVRSMAAGVSKATIPTMAGMTSALTGLMACTLICKQAQTKNELLPGYFKLKQEQ